MVALLRFSGHISLDGKVDVLVLLLRHLVESRNIVRHLARPRRSFFVQEVVLFPVKHRPLPEPKEQGQGQGRQRPEVWESLYLICAECCL